ncbi:hypothetical protein DFH06DRAFT_1327795 [Mycena polygramma]|nr:hypothetical protein DFH06DRAFT_1327795 [Mycena polygramma]
MSKCSEEAYRRLSTNNAQVPTGRDKTCAARNLVSPTDAGSEPRDGIQEVPSLTKLIGYVLQGDKVTGKPEKQIQISIHAVPGKEATILKFPEDASPHAAVVLPCIRSAYLLHPNDPPLDSDPRHIVFLGDVHAGDVQTQVDALHARRRPRPRPIFVHQQVRLRPRWVGSRVAGMSRLDDHPRLAVAEQCIAEDDELGGTSPRKLKPP